MILYHRCDFGLYELHGPFGIAFAILIGNKERRQEHGVPIAILLHFHAELFVLFWLVEQFGGQPVELIPQGVIVDAQLGHISLQLLLRRLFLKPAFYRWFSINFLSIYI